jgi:cell division protein FtsW
MRASLLVVASSIIVLGLVMIFSTTSAEILDLTLDRSTHQGLIRQICYVFISLALALFVWKVGYTKLLQWSPQILLFFSFLLFLVLVPGIGPKVNGSRRWLTAVGFSFQPSEFVKYVVPAFFIERFLNRENEKFNLRRFLPIIIQCIVPMLLILVEPNNGTAIVLGLTLAVLFFFNTNSPKILGGSSAHFSRCRRKFCLSFALCVRSAPSLLKT